MKILVVEDEKISRMFLARISGMHGKCDVAEDGVIVAEMIKKAFSDEDKYDLIFLDIMLPKLTGHSVLEIIRALENDYEIDKDDKTTVIMTSALKDTENIKKAYENLADGYIVKPIFREKIEEILNKIKK